MLKPGNALRKKLQTLLSKIFPRRYEQALWSIYSTDQFRKVLERERIRADRSGREFSLLIIEVGSVKRNRQAVAQLVQILTKRLRSIDEIGWFDDAQIGVALPDTINKGAWKLAGDISNLIPTTMAPFNCKVYTYPSSWFHSLHDLGNGKKSGLAGLAFDKETRTSQNQRSFSMRKASERLVATASIGGSRDFDFGNTTKSAEPIFSPGMPVWKRLLDIVVTLSCLALFAPVMILITIYIKSVSRGPVFFCQTRVGHLGKPFRLYKFRTMRLNAGVSMHQQHLQNLIQNDRPMEKLDGDNDPRIIPMGKLLRTSGLDELPQLINVLRGEMSLVGPRPCLPYEAENYLRWQTQRFDAVPGITGLWQVSGKNKLTFKEMVRLDIKYARASSLYTDVTIILKTVPAILTQVYDGISKKSKGRQNAKVA